jgi:glyoxylase-like metal-dependent hydrolase (beta-lactamase superfamily II)
MKNPAPCTRSIPRRHSRARSSISACGHRTWTRSSSRICISTTRGATRLEGGRTVPTFPNATLYIQEAELSHARAPNERDRASYRPEDWEPWAAAGRLETVRGPKEIRPGITVVPVRGHNAGMQAIRVDSGGRSLFYFADALPTSAHVPVPWIMGYDLYPVDLIENKRRLLEEAVREQWLCVFEHDPHVPWGTIVEDPDGRRRVTPLPSPSG